VCRHLMKHYFVKNMFNFVDQTPSEKETTQSLAMNNLSYHDSRSKIGKLKVKESSRPSDFQWERTQH